MSRHYYEILREAGIRQGDANYWYWVNRILDLQNEMVRVGLMGLM